MSIRRVRLAEEEKFVPKKDVVPIKDVKPVSDIKSVKNPKPFSPDDSAPEFDPSREEHVTVPSEIQALTKEQQTHIMKKESSRAVKEFKANWDYLASNIPIEARDDVFYADKEEEPEEK